jgi:RecA/RadA recombinase
MGKIKKIIKPTAVEQTAESFETLVQEPQEIDEVVEPSYIDVNELVPVGSTTCHLECSGHWQGAFKLGTMVNLIGDSSSGKSLTAFTVFAECNKLKRFNNHKFIYDDVEAANEFNLAKLFGEQCADRIDQSIRSRTIEDFNDNIANLLDEGEPFIYVLDSFDGLTSEAVLKKDIENRKKREKGNETTGDYGDGKAKIFSRFCSLRIQELRDMNSLLIVISQTRDNIGFGAMFTPKTRSGGKALKFYSAFEIWLACQKKEKKGKRVIETNVQGKISKNKLTGHHGEFYFPILNDYGIDNIKSCINFLMDEGDWTGTKKSVNTKGFLEFKDKKGNVKHPSIKEIIDYIEEEGKEIELYKVCQKTYDKIMESLKPDRKPKY